MTSKRSITLATVIAITLAMLAVAVVQATPPTGQTASTPLIGTLDAGGLINADRIKFQAKGQVDVATYSVTYAAGGFSGWHTHPGILFVTVQSGAVVRTVGCAAVTYGPGQTFVESDEQPVGAVANASAVDPAVLSVTQIVPHSSVRRVDAADAPVCP
jgi:quercetin dioxygenase-like cupin family protein